MHEEEKLMALSAMELLSQRVYKISSAGDADRCLTILHSVDAACAGEYQVLRQIIREHIFVRMKQVVSEERHLGSHEGVYAIEFSDGCTKIGRTKHYAKRRAMLANQATSAIVQSKFFPCFQSPAIEAMAHRRFAKDLLKNEFFNIPFSKACEFLDLATNRRGPDSVIN